MFLTGYGLVKSYDSKAISSIYAFKNSIVKLWKLLLPLILIWLVLECYQYSISEGVRLGEALWSTISASWPKIISQVLFVDMLIPQFRGDGLLGTWWYFSLTAQLYAVYYFFIRKRKDYWIFLFSILSVLIQGVLVFYDRMGYLHFVRSNFLGWMLPFCTGVLIGRYGLTLIRPVIFLIFCLIGLVLSEFNGCLWIIKPVFSILVGLLSLHLLYNVISKGRRLLV